MWRSGDLSLTGHRGDRCLHTTRDDLTGRDGYHGKSLPSHMTYFPPWVSRVASSIYTSEKSDLTGGGRHRTYLFRAQRDSFVNGRPSVGKAQTLDGGVAHIGTGESATSARDAAEYDQLTRDPC